MYDDEILNPYRRYDYLDAPKSKVGKILEFIGSVAVGLLGAFAIWAMTVIAWAIF